MEKNLLWKIVYNRFEPDEEGLREALCTLGNGYFGTRGAATETLPTEMHYPGTYIAGLYNRLATHIAGRTIYNEDLVNCPNWTYLTFKIRDGEWFCPSTAKILYYRQELDMRNGLLLRKIRFQTRKGQRTKIIEKRIVHMANPHLAAINYSIIPENYSDYITVRTMLDGAVMNMNVERYRQLNSHHWRAHDRGKFTRNGIYLAVKSSQSKIQVCEAAKLRIFVADKEKTPAIEIIKHGKKVIGQEFRMFIHKGSRYQIEKTVAIYTSKDKGIKNPKIEAINSVNKVKRFNSLLYSHQQRWQELWDKFDVQIEGDAFSQQVLRLHIFHLLQTASVHNIKIDAGFPARGLHGEAYRGHVFWDEIFVFPIFNLHTPEVSKALLMYRYKRLSKARIYAKENGYRGAMFPWQSGSSGKEETQIVHLNPRSGKWGPDHSRLQRHISFSIAYNIWNYWQATSDLDFLEHCGAELFLSIAQFCASLAHYSSKDGRFHIQKVMGPDEFHEKLPYTSEAGLEDNAYTNLMVVWTLLRAEEILYLVSDKSRTKLMKKIKLTASDLKLWHSITKKMNIIINEDKIISQFKGYFKLKDLDWITYRKKYKSIHRMDRILKAEGKSPDAYKVAKQADVLMIFYLLRLQEIQDIFRGLGYSCDRKLLRKNYNYYIKRTSHGSTLSKVVHCFISQLLGKEEEFLGWFREVLKSDIYDTQGGTTPEGIHAGVMGGSVDIVIRGFAGVELIDNHIKINPFLPKKWRRLKFRLYYRKRWIVFDIRKTAIKVHIMKNKLALPMIPVEINSKLHYLLSGKTVTFTLNN